MPNLFHISGWSHLASVGPGDEFTLIPGPQHAEGPGVYFSQDEPRQTSTAEGAVNGVTATVAILVESAVGWWRTKAGIARKFGRPITWHSDRKSVRCTVRAVDIVDGVRHLMCEHEFV